eukprot:scaffold38935_cov63-Phaeocystis_antarctica.AAC.2
MHDARHARRQGLTWDSGLSSTVACDLRADAAAPPVESEEPRAPSMVPEERRAPSMHPVERRAPSMAR